jgi:hypothetical protein
MNVVLDMFNLIFNNWHSLRKVIMLSNFTGKLVDFGILNRNRRLDFGLYFRSRLLISKIASDDHTNQSQDSGNQRRYYRLAHIVPPFFPSRVYGSQTEFFFDFRFALLNESIILYEFPGLGVSLSKDRQFLIDGILFSDFANYHGFVKVIP